MENNPVKALRIVKRDLPDTYVRHGRLVICKGKDNQKGTCKVKIKLHDIKATANPTVDTMSREIRSYHDIVAAHLMADGGDIASIVPSRKGNSYEQFFWYERRFAALLKQNANAIRNLALQVIHVRLWSIASHLDRAAMGGCDE